jgi:hypothetical protein
LGVDGEGVGVVGVIVMVVVEEECRSTRRIHVSSRRNYLSFFQSFGGSWATMAERPGLSNLESESEGEGHEIGRRDVGIGAADRGLLSGAGAGWSGLAPVVG